MSLDKELSAYNAGVRGGVYTGGSAEEDAAHQAGLTRRRGEGGSAGGAGILMLPVLLLIAPIALVVGTCIYPLAGLLTLVVGSLIGGLLGERVNFLMILIAVLLPCIVVFVLGLKLEKLLEQNNSYRLIRHVLRLIVIGFVAHVIIFSFTGAGNFTNTASFLDRISLAHVLLVAVAVLIAHFLSKSLDGKTDGIEGLMIRFRLKRKPWAT